MCSLNDNCPIPFEQQPLNEYFSLKKSWIFRFSTYKWPIYIRYILSIFLCLFICISCILLLAKPIVSLSTLIDLFFLDCLIVDFLIICLCLRLYLGWSYVCKRLLSAIVFYEESGWYDGQIWIKASENLIQDRLIGLYEVNPSIEKVQYTFITFLLLFLVQYSFYSLL